MEHVSYHTKRGSKFIVTKKYGTKQYFEQSYQGLHFLDTMKKSSTIMLTAVAAKKSSYSVRDYSRAVSARSLQNIIGRPRPEEYNQIVNNNLLNNSPITSADIAVAKDCFGKNIGLVTVKTVRKKSIPVRTHIVPLPLRIKDKYREVTNCAEVMKINGIPFFVFIPKDLYFRTIEYCENQRASTYLKYIDNIVKQARLCGFKVVQMEMDREFKPLQTILAADPYNIILNVTSRDEHFWEAERNVRTCKDIIRSCIMPLPFKRRHKRMIIELACGQVFWLNCFPNKYGVSYTLSP